MISQQASHADGMRHMVHVRAAADARMCCNRRKRRKTLVKTTTARPFSSRKGRFKTQAHNLLAVPKGLHTVAQSPANSLKN